MDIGNIVNGLSLTRLNGLMAWLKRLYDQESRQCVLAIPSSAKEEGFVKLGILEF